MNYTKDIDEDELILVTREYYYAPSERLMCNSCGTVSSNHFTGKLFLWKHISWPADWNPQRVTVHTCKRCGRNVYKDFSHSFTDSGNYECDETAGINEWKKELSELEAKVENLKFKIKRGEARWAELWETDQDSN